MFFSFSFPFDKRPDCPPQPHLVAREKPSKERRKDGTCTLTKVVHVFVFVFFLIGSKSEKMGIDQSPLWDDSFLWTAKDR